MRHDFLEAGLRRALQEPELFSARVLGRPLRPYQAEVARAVLDSVCHRRGLTFTVMMARQCLDGDTVILQRHGGACRLRQHPGAWRTGVQPVLRLELRDGLSLVGTLNHPVRTRRGWVPLADLTLTDEVAVLRGWARGEPSGAARRDESFGAGQARLLGWLAAGGRLATAFDPERPPQSVIVRAADPAALDQVEALARALFPSLTPRRRQRGRAWELFLVERGTPGQRPLRAFLRGCDLDHGFPRRAFTLPEDLAAIFAEAVQTPALGGDRVRDEPFARYLQVLLARLGRASRVIRRGAAWRLRPGPALPAGADPLPGSDGEQLGWSRVRGLAAAGEREVWDLAVPGKGWFIANGVVVHNSGKNELSAHLEALLLNRTQRQGGQLVKAAPTMNPQVLVSMRRLEGVLNNPLNRGRWAREQGRIIRLGNARALFFSADESAQVVGATADLLLEIDEAQDVNPDKYERDFRPMAAVANATTVLYGTAWSADTLLARQKRLNRELEARDGITRHFEVSWTEAARHNPAYGAFVQAEIARLGEDHPTIRTQYRLLDLDRAAGLFSPQQLALLQGDHTRQHLPTPGRRYVAGVDLAGEDEAAQDAALRALKPRRDSTVVTLCEVEWSAVAELVREPRLRVVEHYYWTGRGHRAVYEQLLGLLRDRWHCQRIVVDATGVGAGVASFLLAALGPRIVQPFVFTAPSKSALAYRLLDAVNAGRLTLYRDDGSAEWRECWHQLRHAQYEPGAYQRLSFFVPERDGHDDFLMSLALAAEAAALSEVRRASGRVLG